LAELAEAGEIAADLGRVDVGVLGEFLRGDRLAAHLARLGKHLQVAAEPSRHAQRQPLAFDREGARVELFDHLDHAPTVSSRARTDASSKRSSEATTPSTSTTGMRSRWRRSRRSSLSMSTSCSSNRYPSEWRPTSAPIASSQRWQPGRE